MINIRKIKWINTGVIPNITPSALFATTDYHCPRRDAS